MTRLRFSSNFSKDFLSDVDTVFSGILAMDATIFSMSSSLIVFFLLEIGTNFCLAPASSTTSIALSGSFESCKYLFESSTADLSASFE